MFKAVIFDLDGTLVDSAPDIVEAANTSFAPLGVPPFLLDDMKAMIEAGSAVLIERVVKAAGLAFTPESRAETLGRFMGAYKEVSALGRGLYPGAIDLLTRLDALAAFCSDQ